MPKRYLRAAEVRAIRRLAREGERITHIAAAFGIGREAVSHAVKRVTHANVPDEPPPRPHALDSLGLDGITTMYAQGDAPPKLRGRVPGLRRG